VEREEIKTGMSKVSFVFHTPLWSVGGKHRSAKRNPSSANM